MQKFSGSKKGMATLAFNVLLLVLFLTIIIVPLIMTASVSLTSTEAVALGFIIFVLIAGLIVSVIASLNTGL